MDQATAAPAPTRRHMIRRPRLTALLDQSDSSLILLVAPAGYGKTTLAQEWSSEGARSAIWYEVTPASADVAVLAASIGRVLDPLFPDAADLVVDRLRAAREAEADHDSLADALEARIPHWPESAWLVLDDYHNLMESEDAEKFVARLASFTRLLIVSRRRPTWLTARQLLYGEIREVGANALAMTDPEAAAVLQLPDSEAAAGLVSLASGWPAVIGLAALTPRSLAAVEDDLPETLHEFFAEELFRAFPGSLKSSLVQLSIAPHITKSLTAAVVGDAAEALLRDAATHGFLTSSPGGGIDLHPLLRQFLRAKLDLKSDETHETVNTLVNYLLGTSGWDDAFSVIEGASRFDLLPRLLDTALDEVLRRGRVATVRRWVTAAKTTGTVTPQVELAMAEVSFREGRHAEAEMQALDAARGLRRSHALHSRALYRAAQSAQLGDRALDALHLHQEAARTATTLNDERQAIWGQFITHTELGEKDEARAAVLLFERSRPTSIEDKLRQAQAHLSSAIRWGGVGEALKNWRHRLRLAEAPCDPLIKTGFLQMLGTAMALGAEYAEALSVSEVERSEAQRVGLAFVLPHALCMRASAENGLRRYAAARKTLREATEHAASLGDNHSATNARVIEAKVLLALRMSEEALEVVDAEPPDWPNLVMQAEFFGVRALVHACSGNSNLALHFAERSAEVSDQVEADLPMRWARGINRLRATGVTSEAFEAFDRAEATGHLDSIVWSYRAYPPLLQPLSEDSGRATLLFALVENVGDYALARSFKLPLREPPGPRGATLTSREKQVVGLLCQGLSNAEISKALWIEQSTTKVHVRNILRKLGVRTRTEAAVLAAEEGLGEED